VALVGRRRDRVEEVTREIGDSAFAIAADVSRTSEIEHLLDQTVRRFGGLNFLLNNAGVLHIGSAEQITEEQWDDTFNVNVRAVWLLSRAALPQGRKSSLCWTAQLNELDTRRFDPVAKLAQFPDHLLRAFAFPGFDHRRTPFFITHLPVQKDPN